MQEIYKQCNVHSKWVNARHDQGHSETTVPGERHETVAATVAAVAVAMTTVTMLQATTHKRQSVSINQKT